MWPLLLRVGEDRREIAQVQQGAAQHRLDEDMAHPVPAKARAPSTDVPYRLPLGAMVSARTSRMSRC